MLWIMVPMKHSTIFKSRWMALVWAAGIIWFALDVAAPTAKPADPGNSAATADPLTDATGNPVTSEDAQKIADIVNGL